MALSLAFPCFFTGYAHAQPSVAFYYGAQVPPEMPELFDYLVLQPDQLPDGKPLPGAAARQCAYLSMGELGAEDASLAALPKSLFLSANSAWNTFVPDQADARWQAYVSSRAATLWDAGWRCLFLDTLDSYELAGPQKKDAQAAALAQNVSVLKQHGRSFELMFNRGFELLPSIGRQGAFIVAESLFRSFKPGVADSFFAVQPSDTQWLAAKLRQARDSYGLKPVVIDYVRTGDRKLARETAKKIAAQGFIPWVTDPDLSWPGTGLAEAQPRKLLVLFDGREYPDGPWYSDFHTTMESVFEHLGLRAEYHDASLPLPTGALNGRYAGVAAWFTDDTITNPADLRGFFLRCVDEGVPLLLLGYMGFPADAVFLEKLGIAENADGFPAMPLTLAEKSPLAGFEAKPPLLTRDLQPWRAVTAVRRHIRIKDATGRFYDPVFTASWGGAAFLPFLTARGFEDTPRYIIDPFAFFSEALRLEPFPVPDPTTENGRAILTVHIDGDGSASRAEYPPNRLSLEELYARVLTKYRLPTTMGPIEGEVGPQGIYPAISPALEKHQRAIFALPHLEAASHSFSHPYHWLKASDDAPGANKYRLDIAGYKFSSEREIKGSVDFVNSVLLSPDKKTKVFLWSGNAMPGPEHLRLAYGLGLANLNGSDTYFTSENQSVARVTPLAREVDGLVQVYAPTQNENRYTQLWTGPFDGYRHVVETFKFLQSPRRLKPISIYYHTYSASKMASLGALYAVYDWALSQETVPLWASQYCARVVAARTAFVGRLLDGGFIVSSRQQVRTLRLDNPPSAQAYGDGVAGSRKTLNRVYVHLAGAETESSAWPPSGRRIARIYTGASAKNEPQLEQANAPLLYWKHSGKGRVNFRFQGHLPVSFSLKNAGNCEVSFSGARLNPDKAGNFTFRSGDTGDAVLYCGK